MTMFKKVYVTLLLVPKKALGLRLANLKVLFFPLKSEEKH